MPRGPCDLGVHSRRGHGAFRQSTGCSRAPPHPTKRVSRGSTGHRCGIRPAPHNPSSPPRTKEELKVLKRNAVGLSSRTRERRVRLSVSEEEVSNAVCQINTPLAKHSIRSETLPHSTILGIFKGRSLLFAVRAATEEGLCSPAKPRYYLPSSSKNAVPGAPPRGKESTRHAGTR